MAGSGDAAYLYDALGRRAAKTVAGVTTRYVHDGWQVVQEYRGAADVRAYTYGNYIDEPLCMVTTTASSADTAYHLQGNNYNVVALTDDSGHVVERYAVEPFGAFAVFTGKGADGTWFTSDDVQASASAVGNEIGFQGRTVDVESGGYYFRNRQYGPVLGRFVGRDPIGYEADEFNLYRFVLNSPANFGDPEGLEACQLILYMGNFKDTKTGKIMPFPGPYGQKLHDAFDELTEKFSRDFEVFEAGDGTYVLDRVAEGEHNAIVSHGLSPEKDPRHIVLYNASNTWSNFEFYESINDKTKNKTFISACYAGSHVANFNKLKGTSLGRTEIGDLITQAKQWLLDNCKRDPCAK